MITLLVPYVRLRYILLFYYIASTVGDRYTLELFPLLILLELSPLLLLRELLPLGLINNLLKLLLVIIWDTGPKSFL